MQPTTPCASALSKSDSVGLLIQTRVGVSAASQRKFEGGIGIPHARSAAVVEATVAFGRTTKGIDFGAADGPATLVFLIVAPAGGGNEHMRVLSALARKLIHQSFKDSLKQAPDADTVVDVFVKEVGI